MVFVQWNMMILEKLLVLITRFKMLIITLTQVVQVQVGQPLLFGDRKFGTLQQADTVDIPVFCSAEQWSLL